MKRKTLSYAEVNANMFQHMIQSHLDSFVDLTLDRFEQNYPGTVSIVGKPALSHWILEPNLHSAKAELHFELEFSFNGNPPVVVVVVVPYLAIFRQDNADLNSIVHALYRRFSKD